MVKNHGGNGVSASSEQANGSKSGLTSGLTSGCLGSCFVGSRIGSGVASGDIGGGEIPSAGVGAAGGGRQDTSWWCSSKQTKTG